MLWSRSNSVEIIKTDEGSPVLDAYSKLGINIYISSDNQHPKTIAIISATPQEGKSTTALNLAITYAHAGKKVMLVDADIRKPSLHIPLRKENHAGLTDLLSSWGSADERITAISGTTIHNLSFLPSGETVANPSELLASKRMDSLLSFLRKNYDITIFDTPTALGAIDAKIISAKCDGVLMVIQHGRVKRRAAKKLKEELHSVKAHLLGAVVNKITRGNAGGYRY